jgi:hypothetical protein
VRVGSLPVETAWLTLSKTFGSDCAPALRHCAIIFCARTHGRCNQHGMSEGIMG